MLWRRMGPQVAIVWRTPFVRWGVTPGLWAGLLPANYTRPTFLVVIRGRGKGVMNGTQRKVEFVACVEWREVNLNCWGVD